MDLWALHSPDAGILEIRLNGVVLVPEVDLHARRPGLRRIQVAEVPLRAGRNGLLFRVVGKNAASRGFGLGLDFLRLE